MAWYRCTGGNGGGGGAVLITKNITENGTYNASSDNADGYSSVNVSVSGGGSASLELKYQDGTSGTTTYTIAEDGIYLIAVVYSHNGSGSYSLPSGRTPSYANDFLINNTKGAKLAVVALQTGDVVTMSATPASWSAFAKVVIKLSQGVTTLVDSATASDVVCNYTLSTGTGTVLCFMASWARQANGTNLYDYTPASVSTNMIAGYVGVNTLLRIFTCDVSNFPTINTKGYDGGGTVVAVLQ